MARNDSSDEEDVGCGLSERALRNKTKSTYLNKATEMAEQDYDEVMEMMDREKQMLDSADQGYLHSLDISMHQKTLERAGDRNTHSNVFDAVTKTQQQRGGMNKAFDSLLEASQQLLDVNRHASRAVRDASASSENNTYAAHEEALGRDRERVKSLLRAGRKVAEREMGAVREGERADSAKHVRGVVDDEEVAEETEAIFGGRKKKEAAGADLGRSLKYMERGVKEMTKGFDPDV